MARDLTAALASGIQAATIRPAILYEGEFASDTINLWSGVGDLSWDSKTWTGLGTLGAISDVEETNELRAAGVTLTLSGIPSEIVSLALSETRQNKPGKLWLALYDGETENLLADPYLIFEGRLDVAELAENGDASSVSIKYENFLIRLERANERRFTHEDQQIDYPGDQGFAYVASLQDFQITWGRAGGSGSGAAGSSSGSSVG